jgi:hypothetical protein
MDSHIKIWNGFCADMWVVGSSALLFDADNLGIVTKREIGQKKRRHVFCRSSDMENLVVSEVDKLVSDWESGTHKYDGLIYMMYRLKKDKILPLYIGKTETIGRGEGNLSANIKNLRRDKSKFARWGDNYAYHIGDLSAAVLPGHNPAKISRKYQEWGRALFTDIQVEHPKSKEPVHFWTRAWSSKEIGIWEDFGPTRLTFLEYLMIGVASSAFPESLLNIEGRNRA